jgi:hypothetical protein
LDPWLFLDARELAFVSKTCSKSWDLVNTSTPFGSFAGAVVGRNPNMVSETGDEVETYEENCCPETDEHTEADNPENSGAQVISIVEAAVTKMKDSQHGSQVPDEWFHEVVAHVRERYTDSHEPLYSKNHIKKLMEFIGRQCGEMALAGSTTNEMV